MCIQKTKIILTRDPTTFEGFADCVGLHRKLLSIFLQAAALHSLFQMELNDQINAKIRQILILLPTPWHAADTPQYGKKIQQLLFQTFGRALQKESAGRCARYQAGGTRQHDIQIQPPIVVTLGVLSVFLPLAINNDTCFHGAPLACSAGDDASVRDREARPRDAVRDFFLREGESIRGTWLEEDEALCCGGNELWIMFH